MKTAETFALEEALDAAINLARQINQMVTGNKEEKGIPVRAFTDSKSLVDSVESCKQVVEGGMRLVVERIKGVCPGRPYHGNHMGQRRPELGRRSDEKDR